MSEKQSLSCRASIVAALNSSLPLPPARSARVSSAGFAGCNRRGAEGFGGRGCDAQGDHPRSTFKTPAEAGAALW